MNQFKKFLQKVKCRDLDKTTTLYCRDVTVELIKEYILWKKEKGNSNDTINKALTPIFKTLRNIKRKGWLSSDVVEDICDLYLPSNSTTLDTTESDKVEYLTLDQIKEFMKYTQECRNPRTRDICDMFLFSFSTCGLRFSDVITLKWSEIDFNTKMIKHLQVKGHTKKTVWLDLPLTDEGIKILEKWKGRHKVFVFGRLPDDFDLTDEGEFDKIKNRKNRTVNTSLQLIGEKLKFPIGVHFHTARHSFAVMALNKEIDIKVISTLMGHSSVTVTEKEYAKFLPDTLKSKVQEKLNICLSD